MGAKLLIVKHAKAGAISAILGYPIKLVKNIKTVTVSVSYTTRTEPDISKGKEFIFDVDKTKESITGLFRKGELDMAAYQFEIIWLNEMGEEQRAYSETVQERDAKIQALADDGYSPVWKEA